MKIIDGTNLVYGRLSAIVAKELLSGEEIIIVNARNVAVTGSREFVFRKFRERLDIGSVRKGPYYPRTSNQILRRSIGDMLPKKKTTGKDALARCKVYSSIPRELQGKQFSTIEEVRNYKVSGFVTLGEVAERLGGKY